MSTATGIVSLRRILSLAGPALLVLLAEPAYVLVDTAVVGRLGREALGALAVGGTVMSVAAWLSVVLAYGTTSRAARQFGAGDTEAALREGVQASWLALYAGLAVAVAMQFLAGPIAQALAATDAGVASGAERWLRIAALGAPGLMLATAGHGWLRGIQDLKGPLRYALTANALSAVLCPILVYPAGGGLSGSAVANVIAQTVGGLFFVRALVRQAPSLRPEPKLLKAQLVMGRDLLVRGAAFQACFLSATAIAARFGTATLGAHQIALQLWLFSAFALDALAIAAQSLVGATLGAGDQAAARSLAWRITRLGLLCGTVFGLIVLAGIDVLPRLFTDDSAVLAQARHAWPWFLVMQPLAGIVFAIDGILIGAGDLRYMRNLTLVAALGGFLPALWIAYAADAGIDGIWAGLTLFIVIRLVAGVGRLRGAHWSPVGATR